MQGTRSSRRVHSCIEAPIPKHQISNKFQLPKVEKNLFGHLKLEFGAYLEFEICDLGS